MLNEQGIDVPVVLGGAALTRSYVEDDLRKVYKGPLFYAKDAFQGLELMADICEGDALEKYASTAQTAAADDTAEAAETDEQAASATEPDTGKRAAPSQAAAPAEGATSDAGTEEAAVAARNARDLEREVEQRFGLREIADDERDESDARPAAASAGAAREAAATSTSTLPRSDIAHTAAVPQPPFWGSRVLERIPLKAALSYMNETMLFQVQWGFRRKGRKGEEFRRYVNQEIRPHYRALVERCEREKILNPQAIYGFWPCNADGDDLVIYAPPGDSGAPADDHGPEIFRFTFPRQKKDPHWCLSDFWRPLESGKTDVAAFSIVTAGQRVSEVAREWFARNEYQQYLFLHGLGVETAEALAEYIHKQIRADLGVSGDDARELQQLFKQGYQGSRYSFGYPACPNLEDQTKLMDLLKPERIGVELSDEYQLEPEQSTSAIVTYHPDARYFNVR